MKYKPLALLLLLTFSNTAISAEVWLSSKVKSVYPLSNGDFIILFQENSPACTSSEPSHYYYVSVGQNGVTLEGSKKIYSAALTAGASGKSLVIAFDDSTANCFINRASVHF